MIRTTIKLDENLFKEARKLAIDKRQPFAKIINEALSYYLEEKQAINKKPFKLKTYAMGPLKGSLSRSQIYEDI